MYQKGIFIILLFFFFFFFDVEGQGPPNVDDMSASGSSFRPSIAVVIGILSIMFSLTFLLLVYAKFCHTTASDLFTRATDQHLHHGLIRTRSTRFSGIDKTVIESLPFFRFSSLKGSKEGLECAVCLSKFEETEILRLLPKCKHAFHIDCVDRWLESHSSCPLCRYKVDARDLTIFTYSNSMRFSMNQSELTEDPNLELFVRREQDDHQGGSSRFSVGSSFRKIEMGKKEELQIQECDNEDDDRKLLHKSKNKTVVSDVVFKNRWSDVNSSDILMLNSEMLNEMSSKRFSSFNSSSGRFTPTALENVSSPNERIMKIKEEMEKKRLFENKVGKLNRSYSVSGPGLPSTSDSELNKNSRFLTPSGKRSMSEITNHSRFTDFGWKNRIKESSSSAGSAKEERRRRLWFPIARRTVKWFVGREKRSQQSQYSRQLSIV